MSFNLKKSQNIQVEVDKAIAIIANLGLEIPPGISAEELIMQATELQQAAQKGQEGFRNIEEMGVAQQQMGQEYEEVQENINTSITGSTTMINNQIKTFNLKKAQIPQVPQSPIGDMGLNDTPELAGDELDELGQIREEEQNNYNETFKFKDGGELKNWLDNADYILARSQLIQFVEDSNRQQLLEDSLNAYYETRMDSNAKLQLATNIFTLLPDSVKKFDINTPGVVMAPYTSANLINNEIKKLAENCVKNKKTNTYNLNKTAQHKSFDNNVIMYGPEQTRLDPFYRQPVSDYSIVERNKGFGFVVDDIWNIDWETIWRGSIMDKYSRPYRNKEGKWVGGYINKRFEVDNWVPETNNYQLKPGERRKPYLPEYASTEARLQDARHKGIIKGGPEVNRSAPFNWKEASSKKKS